MQGLHVSRALLLPALVASLAAPAEATSYIRVSDETLVDQAPIAAVVRIVSADPSAGEASGEAPATEYVARIEEPLKGEAPDKLLKLRVPGGLAHDGLALKVYGAPRFQDGERALVFLEPAGDSYRLVHFFLGAFREAKVSGKSLAVRSLAEAHEVRQTARGPEAVRDGGREPLRDFQRFARWVAARAQGKVQAPDYVVKDFGGEMDQTGEKFMLFEDGNDHYNLRWFEFDSGGSVTWQAHKAGLRSLRGGGYAELQAAMQSWNAEPTTPVNYRYGGTTNADGGLSEFDGVNAVLFDDPRDELSPFSCATGGVLAFGGPWYEVATSSFQGVKFHRIAGADVVVNDGLACLFGSSPNRTKLAEEIFGHELGHALGLSHSCGDGEGPRCADTVLDDALMRAFVHDDSRGARLGEDDRAGLRALYLPGAFPPAAPTELEAATQSTTGVRLTWSDQAANESEFRIEAKTLGGTFAEIAKAPADSSGVDVTGLSSATAYVFRVRAAGKTSFSSYSNEATATTQAPVEPCVADSRTLCLRDGRFRVQVAWRTSDGKTGAGTVVPVDSQDSGLLWFFDSNNWEMLVKVLDGCEMSKRFWVFFAATTDVQYTLTVVDTRTGAVKVYFNPPGNPSDAVTDTGAFATCS